MYTNIPVPDAIPANWFWFQALLILTFVLHLVLMNLVLGGSLLAIWDTVIKKRELPGKAHLPVIIALTINLGVPPLLFVQVLYGHLFYSSSIIMAIPWLLVIPVLLLAYYGSYIYVKNIAKAPLWSKAGLVLSSLFLLYIAFMYVNNSTLSLNPGTWDVYTGRSGGNNLNIGEPSLWPRYLHFILAALSVASLGIALFTKMGIKDDPVKKSGIISLNMRRFAWLTILQAGIGTWFWLSNPRDVWLTFMGGSVIATSLMMLGWLLTISMIISAFRGKLNASLAHLGILVIIMTIIREYLRQAWLKDVFHPKSLQLAKEPGPLVIFLLIFVAGIFLIWYMYRLTTSKPEQS